MNRTHARTLLLFASLAAGCTSSPPEGDSVASDLQPACAEIVLEGTRTSPEETHGIATNHVPTVSVDLTRLTRFDEARVSVAACDDPSRVVTRTIRRPPRAWLVDPSLVPRGENAPSCYRIAVQAYRAGAAVGGASAVVRRGDFSVAGNVTAPAGVTPSGLHVTVQVDKAIIPVLPDSAGRFRLTHAPAGLVVAVRARALAPDGTALRAEIAPLVALDAANPFANVALALTKAPPAVDANEPDDTVSLARARPGALLGTEQTHTMPQGDVDIIPIPVASGVRYRASVRSADARKPDLALTILDDSGVAIAHANGPDDPYQSAPTLAWTSATNGLAFVRVSRNDAEPTDVTYAAVVTFD